MIAQGPWMVRPCRLDAIDVDGHPAPDLKYFEVLPLSCPIVGHLEIFATHFFSPLPSISVWKDML